jgi:hypothetical protein
MSKNSTASEISDLPKAGTFKGGCRILKKSLEITLVIYRRDTDDEVRDEDLQCELSREGRPKGTKPDKAIVYSKD